MKTATITDLEGKILAVFEEGHPPVYYSSTARDLFADGVELADRTVEHGAEGFFEALVERIAPMSYLALRIEDEEELEL